MKPSISLTIVVCTILVSYLALFTLVTASSYNYDDIAWKTFGIQQKVDNFNLNSVDTYTQRVVVSGQFIQPGKDIKYAYIYLGGEAPIEYYRDVSGGSFALMGAENNAILGFVEHRYYGKSWPFGTEDESKKHLEYLNTEQALEDAAVAIELILQHFGTNLDKTKVVVAGGSYAGMMAAYFRIKYPHIARAAVVSSAPFTMMGNTYKRNDPINFAYFKTVTDVYRRYSKTCSDNIAQSFKDLEILWNNDKFKEIQHVFTPCSDINTDDAYNHLKLWIRQAFVDHAQGNFPSKIDGKWPAQELCTIIKKQSDSGAAPLLAVSRAVHAAYPIDPQKPQCHNIWEEYIECIDDTGCGGDPFWDYQACSQLMYYPSTNNVTDMFPAHDHTDIVHTEYCKKTYNLDYQLNYRRLSRSFPSHDWSQSTNIIFTNGVLDPWCHGGIQTRPNEYTLAINIPNAAHHYDLNTPHYYDTKIIQSIRQIESQAIQALLQDVPQYDTLKRLQDRIDASYAKSCDEMGY